MRVIKLYRKPNKPEYFEFIRAGEWGLLVVYPIDKPNRKRMARWLSLNDVYIDWIREFNFGVV
jgi:hypothetical protein